MSWGTLIVCVLFFCSLVSGQVLVQNFQVNTQPGPWKVGVYDVARQTAHFFGNAPAQSSILTLSFPSERFGSLQAPTAASFFPTLSTPSIGSADIFAQSRELFVGGDQKISKFDLDNFTEVVSASVEYSIKTLAVKEFSDDYSDSLLFAANAPPAGVAAKVYLFDARNLKPLHTLSLSVEDGAVSQLLFDDKRNFLYLSTSSLPGRIIRVALVGRVLVRVDHLELPTGWAVLNTAFLDKNNEYAYFGVGAPQGRIIRVDLSSFTRSNVFDAPGTPAFSMAVYDAVRGYSYWVSDVSPVVYRFEMCGFKYVDRFNITNKPSGYALGPNGLVFSTETTTFTLVNVLDNVTCPDTAAFRRVASRKESCLLDARAGVTAVDKNVAYFVTNTPEASLITVDLSSPNLNSTKAVKLGMGYGRSIALDQQRHKLFVGLNDRNAGQLVKVDVSPNRPPQVLGSKHALHGVQSIAFDQTNNILYACTNPNKPGLTSGAVHKLNAETLELVDTVDLAAEDGGCGVLVYDSMRDALYAGTNSFPTKLVKITTQPFARQTDITLNAQFNTTSTGFIDSSYSFAYFGTWHPFGAIIKVNLNTFTLVDILAPSTDVPGFTVGLEDPANGVSYWFTNQVPAQIIRVRLCDFSIIDSFPLRRGEGVPFAATLSARGGLILATSPWTAGNRGTSNQCGSLIQLTPVRCFPCAEATGGLTRASTVIVPSCTTRDLRAGFTDYHTGTGYFVSYTVPSYVITVDLNNLALKSRLALPGNLGRAAAYDGSRRKGFFGMATTPGAVAKVDLSTFSVEKTLSTPYSVKALAYDEVDGVLYAATNTPGETASFIHKINGKDLSVISTIMLEPRDGAASTLQLDRKRGYIYVGTKAHPARIVRVKLNRFERVNYIEFPTGYNEIGTPSLADGDRATFTINKPFPRLVTVGFDGFKRLETLDFPASTPAFSAAVNDPVTGYALWFTDSAPSTVFRVRLCNFTIADKLVLRENDGVPRAAIYGVGKVTAGSSCTLTNSDNLCSSTFKSTLFQLKGGRQATCDFTAAAEEPTTSIVNSTIVSLRFNFKGMLPPVRFCNSTK
eukprot:TRINITY_DN278_c0_g1_i2.p1 TRINITY_DN278_c0_g1~~TRINITY_DN278_c0_g1_i2.p1  ORF type:complete len:1073 (-),score=287.99 TRINITY_DN278_c0_g1_i2:200-3418(-)